MIGRIEKPQQPQQPQQPQHSQRQQQQQQSYAQAAQHGSTTDHRQPIPVNVKKERKPGPYVIALQTWNKQTGGWKIPKRGTKEHAEVLAVMVKQQAAKKADKEASALRHQEQSATAKQS